MKKSLALGLLFISFALSARVFAEDDVIAKAQQLYEEESFDAAYQLITSSIPESGSPLKTQASNFLASIGVQEYNIKNYKNAFEAFRKALKYDPTNTTATQYFLKMRKEMDTANLKNEAPPRQKNTGTASTQTGVASSETAGATAVSTAVGSTAPAQQLSSTELEELKRQLEAARTQLTEVNSVVSSTSQENAALRAQVDQQLKMLQSVMSAQSKQTSAVPQPSAQDRELIAKTVELLAKLSEQETNPQPVVMQTDPELKNLVQELAARNRDDRPSLISIIGIIGIVILALAVFSLIIIFLSLAKQAKARSQMRTAATEGMPAGLGTPYQPNLIGQNQSQNIPSIMGFIEGSSETEAGTDIDLRRELIKADRMKRMYDEVKSGILNWNTVRDYISELDVALRAEILNVVERKLMEGDIISNQAILPVIFPFLTDYDDFIREKAENLARQALLTGKTEGVGVSETAQDPLSVASLMKIPEELGKLLKGHDQSIVTAKLSRGIGSLLGLSNEQANLLYKAALAHDCGYLMLDKDELQRIVSKPEITEEEFSFIQSHAVKGPLYFSEIELPDEFRQALIYHHERNDGTGYPDGLKKGQIPLFAKIIGVAETFASLVSKRNYRDKHSVEHALAIIRDGVRNKFDADIIDALCKIASTSGRM